MEEVIRFRAGRCEYNEETKICKPMSAIGKIVIRPSEEAQGFYDFKWSVGNSDSESTAEPIEFILIPGETKWVDIQSAKNGRVLCLLFSTGEKWFFWLQDKHKGSEALNQWSEQDKELLAKLQKLLEYEEDKQDEDEVMGEAEQEKNDFKQTTAKSESNEEESHKSKTKNTADDSANASAAPQEPNPYVHIKHLSDFLTKDMLVTYIDSLSEDSKQFKDLCECLPTDIANTKDNLLKCVRGPFFQQAVDILDTATKQDFSGHQLSQMFGYSYGGEGPLALIEGMRKKGLKEKNEDDTSKQSGDEK